MDFGSFTSGLLTGLREGVEAALIVSIVLTYLVRTGSGDQVGRVWLGTGLAAVPEPRSSGSSSSTRSARSRRRTSRSSRARRCSRGRRRDLDALLDAAPGGSGQGRAPGRGRPGRRRPAASWGLALLAFTAVIREGLETSLFLVGQATSDRGREAVWILRRRARRARRREPDRLRLLPRQPPPEPRLVLPLDRDRARLHRGRPAEPRHRRVHRDRRARQRPLDRARPST